MVELLDAVGIPDPLRRLTEYPHQLSGGLKQRIMIAMALAGEPDLLIADEPTTALDVTIQAQVLVLLRELQRTTGMAILLITHDLGVVAEVADRVAVMYAGQIVETARRDRLFSAPAHPYTRKLFASVPDASKRGERLAVIPGAVPPLSQEFHGCRFAARCDYVWQLCREREPPWTATDETGVRCHLADPEHAGRPPPPLAAATASAPALVASAAEPLLEVTDLRVHFPIRRGVLQRVTGQVRAVDGVSLRIRAGHTLALVGESGCGKTTVGKGILQLLKPSAGSVRFADTELTRLAPRQLRAQRAHLQVIFQDPYASMNPRMLVGDILEEGMIALGTGGTRAQRRARIDELLQQCGLASEARQRYPHEFSGGQRQRICIARALTVGPRLVICDEPTSALDVSVQAQILNLLKDLQARLGLAYLFITHNIAVVEYLAHEVAVMYLGRIVERGPSEAVLTAPRHPYTQALLSAVPVIDPGSRREVIRLGGELPSPAAPPSGCHFSPRCPQAMAECHQRYPEETELAPGHLVRCHLLTG
jgi:peptide/nickel transport system ATP-binding protein